VNEILEKLAPSQLVVLLAEFLMWLEDEHGIDTSGIGDASTKDFRAYVENKHCNAG